MKQTKLRGFSLLELLITIVILSVITTIAVNSYQASVRKARRADAKADLMELAQLLERNYTETNSFATDISGNAVALAYNVSPQQGNVVFYNLAFAAGFPTPISYVIVASPAGPQNNDTRCMNLTLDHTGTKGISGSGSVAECW
ncbi:MAG: type IV pilin protein [Gammaproteobacteria bacterium]